MDHQRDHIWKAIYMPNNKVIKSIDYNIVGDCSHLNMKFTIPAKGLTEEEINSIIKKLV